MSARLLLQTTAFVLGSFLISNAAMAYIDWAGAGWYVEATYLGAATELMSGPYADQGACNVAKPADNGEVGYFCQYEASDPHYDGG